jgi:hypothetical protein
LALCLPSTGQFATSSPQPAKTLEQKFFAALRSGNSKALMSYVPENGVNLGAQHATKEEIGKQLQQHRGVYCKLFDSSCLNSQSCSYRELLSRSEKVRTAASEVTRNGVRQAVLVAQVQNQRCPDQKLIDFIFNLQGDSWKLFSMP